MESFDKTISPATPEQKLEALRRQAEAKGRPFNEEKTREMLGIPTPVESVGEPEVAEKPKAKRSKKEVAEKPRSKSRIKAK